MEGMMKGMDTKFLVVEPDCLARTAEILPQINTKGLPVLLVCDEHTRKVAGERVAGILKARGIPCEEFVLKPGPYKMVTADYEGVELIRDRLKSPGAFALVVGSGTLNDLVKRASGELEQPYICVGTASSMDGYCSFGASLVYQGYKTTLPCPPPAAVIADTAILKAAPYEMTASGYGDLYAKLAAGVDWMLADRLGIEKIHRESWDLVQKDLPSWVASPEKLRRGDDEAFSALFKGLTMAGLAMQVYKDSRPASGAEHMISHVWEMRHLSRPDGVPYSHGFKVSVGTSLTVPLMMALYRLDPAEISPAACLKRRESWEDRQAAVERFFPDPKIGATVLKVCRDKWLDPGALERRMETLREILPELRAFAGERLASPEKVTGDLKKAGCPTTVEEFGLTRRDLKETVMKAQMIRARYTSLDAIYETGLLPELLDRLF
jgi:glycerol-1-phosphate dehydrogenase [NAD(P)+]